MEHRFRVEREIPALFYLMFLFALRHSVGIFARPSHAIPAHKIIRLNLRRLSHPARTRPECAIA
jgi:hypothetical protein